MSKFGIGAFAAVVIIIGIPAYVAGFVWTLIKVSFEAGGDMALELHEELEELKS